MTSSIKSLLIFKPDKQNYVPIERDNSEHNLVRAIGFPIYSSDLVLGVDRYPEYELIKHLPNKDIIEYFLSEDKSSGI